MTDESDTDRPDEKSGDKPTLRQRLHNATGDRDAEAAALADRASDDVSTEEAKETVRRADGDFGKDQPAAPGDIATTEDVEDEPADPARRDDVTGANATE